MYLNLIGQLNDKGPTHTNLLTGFPSTRAPLLFRHALTTLLRSVPDRHAALTLNLGRDTYHAYHSDIYACSYTSIRKATGDSCVSKRLHVFSTSPRPKVTR
jgi:hypothetical protein